MTNEPPADDSAALAALRAALAGRLAGARPRVAVIAGSGLGAFARTIEAERTIPYDDLPHVGTTTVSGHSGTLVCGRAAGIPLIVLNGRRHLYEGVAPRRATLLLRALLLEQPVDTVIISNAAGGLNPCFEVADLMLIADQINWMFRNPLVGHNPPQWGPRFPDASNLYSRHLRQTAREAAREAGVPLREGVYVGVHGPSYETRAEIRMLRTVCGADAVGMSTVPETLVAAQMGRQVLGLSVITNLVPATGPTTHDEVIENSRIAEQRFRTLLHAVLARLAP